MPATRAFSHLALAVTDLTSMSAFYVDALGYELGPVWSAAGRRVAGLMDARPDGFDGVYLKLGDFRLELLCYKTRASAGARPRDPSAPGYAHTSYVVEDLEGTIAAIEKAGGTFHTKLSQTYEGPGESIIVFCLDPDGNRVELVWHSTPLELDAHRRFLRLDVLGWPAASAVEVRSR